MTRYRIPSKFRAYTVLGLVWLAIGPASAFAQFDRYEVGRRLREFEVEWDRVSDLPAKAAASRSLKAGVNAFFSFRPGDAGRALTEARFALRPGPPTDGERWAESLCLKPEARLIDATTPSLPVTLAVFYPTEAKKPEDARIRLALGASADCRIEVPIGALPMAVTLPIRGLAAGDYILVAEILSGGKTLAKVSQTISPADRVDDRLTDLRRTIAAWPEDAESVTVDRESARSQLRLLESLAAKLTLETDFPAGGMLADLEAQTQAADQSDAYLGDDRPGQFWVTVVTRAGRRIATRVFVPEAAAKGDPLPIVVALHGAGGSENMFFDGYGHGAIVDRCRERGWFLVAPRSTAFGGSPLAEIVDELAKIYTIDLKRVMLVGHSMGAGQVSIQATSEPARYAVVAALGGGGSIRSGVGLKDLPFFVGVGSEDFTLPASKNLAETLQRAGVATVIYREYPGIEHLAIVQVALPDVFRFFDERGKSKKP